MKLRLLPTGAVWAPGAVIVGGVLGSTTVTVTYPGTDVTPSVTMKVIVNVPVWASLGVQVKTPLGDVPWVDEKVAPVGSWEALIASEGAGTEESTPVTLKVTLVSSSTVCVEGTFKTSEP